MALRVLPLFAISVLWLLAFVHLAGAEDLDARVLLERLDDKAVPTRALSPETRSSRVLDESGAFSVSRSAQPSQGRPRTIAGYWGAKNTASSSDGFELQLDHYPDGSWIKGRIAGLSRNGMEGVLLAESENAKYLIDFDSDEVETHISLETFRASALFCGRARQMASGTACSLVHVVLHERETIRFHSLILGSTPNARGWLIEDFAKVLASLQFHSGEAAP